MSASQQQQHPPTQSSAATGNRATTTAATAPLTMLNTATTTSVTSATAAPPHRLPGTAGGVVTRKRPAPISTAPNDLGRGGGTDAEVAAIADHAAAAAASATSPSKRAATTIMESGDSRSNRPMSRSPTTTPTPTSGADAGTGGTGGSASSSATKPYKGLRHFSMMVCKKVEEKGTTTYNEVADELVQHVITERRKEQQQNDHHHSSTSSKFDEKNIRRRVYDALNVLMAMDIIIKDKKAISWKGLPTTAHQDLEMLEREREYRQHEIIRKREALRELLVQQICFRNLVSYNQRRSNSQKSSQQHGGATATDTATTTTTTTSSSSMDHKIPLPFIIVNTHSTAVIQCNMSRDLTDVMFDFSQPFEINDDNTILKRLGFDKTNRQTLLEMLPLELLQYAEKHGLLTSIIVPENTDDNNSTTTAAMSATTTTAAPAATVVAGGGSADYHPPVF